MHGGQRLFDVDSGVGRQGQTHLAPPDQDVGADGGAQLGEQHGECLGVVLRRRAGPDRLDQLVAADRAGPLEHEIREQRAALPAREPLLDTTPAELDHEVPAELDIGVRLRAPTSLQPLMQHTGKARSQQSARQPTMARQITCECGQIVRGETEHELVELTLSTSAATTRSSPTSSRATTSSR